MFGLVAPLCVLVASVSYFTIGVSPRFRGLPIPFASLSIANHLRFQGRKITQLEARDRDMPVPPDYKNTHASLLNTYSVKTSRPGPTTLLISQEIQGVFRDQARLSAHSPLSIKHGQSALALCANRLQFSPEPSPHPQRGTSPGHVPRHHRRQHQLSGPGGLG